MGAGEAPQGGPVVSEQENTTIFVQNCLEQLRVGDANACAPLINRAYARVKRLAERMFRDFQRMQRYIGPDDVAQDATKRLMQALAATPPATAKEFFRLASTQIRRVLIDATRHYFGPHGDGANQVGLSPLGGDGSTSGDRGYQHGDSTFDPGRLAIWREFHEAVQSLPEEEREVFDLLWYHEINQAEAAEALGVSVPTIKRRWMAARLRLQAALKDQVPEQ
jgi:RNA polymerase sigma-70 factor (ECF subfamily)